jgi:hypothetical protein
MLLLAATVVAACGGEEEMPRTAADRASESTAALVAEAGESTSTQGSSRVAVDATLILPGGDEESFSGEGAFDYDEQVGRLTVELAGTPTEVVFDGDVVYAEVPPGALPLGRRWVKIDLRSLGAASGIDLAQLVQAGQTAPGRYLRWLSAARDVERVGEETVRGVETTHYRALIDLERLATEEPELRDSLRALSSEQGLDAVPTEVWIDGDGLVRRLRQDYETSPSGAKTRTSVTMELYDFGVEVDAERPEPEEVFDISELIGG